MTAVSESPHSVDVPLRRNRDFRLLWMGGVASELGTQASEIAFPLLLLAITGSAGYAGMLTSAQMVTYVLMMLPAGVLADRFDRRRLMVFSDFFRAGLLAVIAAMVIFDVASVVALIAIAVLISVADGVFAPTQDASLKQLVSRRQLNDAYAVDQARTQAARLLGTVVGGWLYALARFVPFLGNMFTFLVSGTMVSLIRRPLNAQPEDGEPRVGWRGAFEGFRFLFTDPLLRVIALLSTGTMFTLAAFPLIYLASLHAEHIGAGLIGMILAAYGIAGALGAVAAPLILRAVRPNILFVLATWLVPALLTVLAVTDYLPVVVTAASVLFFSLPPVTSLVRGYLAAITPSRLQGRVFASLMVVGGAFQPIAPVAFGTVFDSAGRFWAYLGMAIAGAVTATLSLSKPVRRLTKLE